MQIPKTLSLAALAATSISFGLGACGGSGAGSNPGGGDGGGVSDVDPAGTHHKYVVNTLIVPASASQANSVAQDLDGDGIADNALGGLLGALTATASLDLQTSVDDQLTAADFILLMSVKATDLGNANKVGTFLFFGDNPNPAGCTDPAAPTPATCGKHLSGSATFDLAANSPSDAVIVSTLAGGALLGGPGKVAIELPLGGVKLQLDLIAAHIDAAVTADGITSGKLGGAITEKDVDEKLMPAIQSLIEMKIAEDCTGVGADCGCTDPSSGKQVLGFFDTNKDCKIPLSELNGNSLIDATIRNPDLDLLDANGNFNPNSDGVNDSLSFGVGFTAVGAKFTVPAGL